MSSTSETKSAFKDIRADSANAIYSKLVKCEPGEEIAITGISGVYSKADNILELAEKLWAKEDLVSEIACQEQDGLGPAPRYGKINEDRIRKFDASFFKIPKYGADGIDPQSRMLLELAYEAVMDAGYNPEYFRGTKTGVFVSIFRSDSEESWIYENNSSEGLGFYGNTRSMIGSRISFAMGLTGPISAVDSACASSFTALDCAFKNIRTGVCDAAIVAGCNLMLNWQIIKRWYTIGMISQQGKCQTFSQAADGYCRSEGVVALLIQKKKDARRMYAEVIYVKINNNGDKAGAIEKTSDTAQIELLEEFYTECRIDPTTLNFVELHGTGTKVGDVMEANALDKVFCKSNRKIPLKVGSIKSNMGHSEGVSGLCSISKAILMFEREMIPPNLHFCEPRSEITALKEGRIQVVTEVESFFDNLIAVTNLGYGGSNGHILLRHNIKRKIKNSEPANGLQRLIMVSGRTEGAVQKIFDHVIGKPIDSEFVRLLHEIFSENIPNHNYRGYVLSNICGMQINKQIENFLGGKRPVWFIFRGMGCQYPGMGKALLNLPITRDSINKSHETLKKKGLDLTEIITKDDPNMFNDILHSFVGIAAIQIALVDLLRTIGINPDGMIGHSVGELGCAYADNCFTAEQMILAAYYRGKASNDTIMEPGYMAAVGLPYDDLKSRLPADIDIACHNAPNNYTISGPQESVKRFIISLDEDGVFARLINVSNIAYHSRYVRPIASKLFPVMKTVIPEPTLRSKKWICSSVPETDWNIWEVQNSCAEYYVNNLKNCVYFEEACRHIPNDAITIEISPQGFFQSLIKRVSNLNITNVPLLSRDSPNGIDFLFCALGRLYTLGVNPEAGLHKIYPTVSFPVSRGTPMISPLIEWQHDTDYFVTKHFLESQKASEQTITISLNNSEWEFIYGHVIDGRTLFPGTGYIYLVWKMFSKIEGVNYFEHSIVIENLKLRRAVILSKKDKVEFKVNIQKASGFFEIIESDTIVASGRIKKMEKTDVISEDIEIIESNIVDEDESTLRASAIYKDYHIRGYQYKEPFMGITKAKYNGSTAILKWKNNYTTFLDSLIQIFLLSVDSRDLLVPTGFERVTINAELHKAYLNRSDTEYPEFIAYYDKHLSMCKSAGIEIKGMVFHKLQRKPLRERITLQKIEFLPFTTENYNIDEALIITSEIIKHSINCATIQTLELVDGTDPNLTLISPTLKEILDNMPQTRVEMTVMIEDTDLQLQSMTIPTPDIEIRKWKLSGTERFTMIVASNLIAKNEVWQFCLNALSEGGYLLLRDKEHVVNDCIPKEFEICLNYQSKDERIRLCQKKKILRENIRTICINSGSFDWIETVRSALQEVIANKDERVILYAENDEFSGILGLSNCLFKEYGTKNLRCYLIADNTAPPFSLHDPFYKRQISKDLLVNVYRNASWGLFCDFLLHKRHKINVPHAELQQEISGDMSSLSWVEGQLDPLSSDYAPDKTLLHVYYSELNFRDVMTASAKLSTAILSTHDYSMKTKLGLACSGKGVDGKRYTTIAKSGCFTTLLNQDSDLLIPVPNHWTLEDAATVPIVYLTVIYCFFNPERLHRGDSILIHSGAGGVGQAAIHIALYYGCNVFTTVGTRKKRDFIRENFPTIPESHIGYSRDISFEKMIMKETNGRGVDVVLNSLAEEKLLASVRCLAAGGRFIEIGLYDFQENNPLYMGCFLKRISFHAIDLFHLLEMTSSERKHIINLMVKHINNGAVKPLNRNVFDWENAEAAFRYMASGKHIGRILLQMRQEEVDINSVPKLLSVPVSPQFYCSNKKSYVICGGLGGLGLELIDWLIFRGARILVISSRTGITTDYQRWKVQKWKCRGAQIIINTNDITKEQGVQNLLQIANGLSPIEAIFNLAMVLRDGLFENQTEKSFYECSGPKINATLYLDQLSRKMCPNLKHFVVFSSVSNGFGNLGQTNYCLANSVMERICEKRNLDNLPGIAIQWGPMAEVGALGENKVEKTSFIEGFIYQPVYSFLNEMNFLLRQPNAVVRSTILNKIQSFKTDDKNIFDILGRVFGLKEMEKLDPKSKLSDYGMDSIMSIEVKQMFEREFDITISTDDIKVMTIGSITELKNTTKANDVSTSVATSKTVQSVLVKWLRYSFDFMANRIPAEIKTEEWDIVLQKSPEENGNKDFSFVFVFPGFEGNSEYMENITNPMNAHVYTIQYGSDNVENVQQIVRELAQRIYSLSSGNKNYIFIAHSFGCFVALQVLKILEAQKKVGRLFLIDAYPITQYSMLTKLEKTDQITNEIIRQFLSVFWPKFPESILNDTQKVLDWSSKVKSIMSQIPADLSYTKQQLTYVLNLIHGRNEVVTEWGFLTEQPLATLTTSFKPTVDLLEDNFQYDFSQHFVHPVDIQMVEGNHFTMVKNVKISDF